MAADDSGGGEASDRQDYGWHAQCTDEHVTRHSWRVVVDDERRCASSHCRRHMDADPASISYLLTLGFTPPMIRVP